MNFIPASKMWNISNKRTTLIDCDIRTPIIAYVSTELNMSQEGWYNMLLALKIVEYNYAVVVKLKKMCTSVFCVQTELNSSFLKKAF